MSIFNNVAKHFTQKFLFIKRSKLPQKDLYSLGPLSLLAHLIVV